MFEAPQAEDTDRRTRQSRFALSVGEGAFVLAVLIVALAVLTGCGDEAVTAAHEREAQERKANVKPADVVWMRLPLECEQWLATRGAGEKWRKVPVCADLTKRAAK